MEETQESDSVLRDLFITTYLHFDHKKFWEISLDGHTLESVIRYGKLLDFDIEEPFSIQSSRKVHKSLGEGYEFIETLINAKKAKGYKRLLRETEDSNKSLLRDSEDLSKYDPTPKRPIPSPTVPATETTTGTSSLKRKVGESLMPETLKQVHKNEPSPRRDSFLEEIPIVSLYNSEINTKIEPKVEHKEESRFKPISLKLEPKIEYMEIEKPAAIVPEKSRPAPIEKQFSSESLTDDQNSFKGAYLIKKTSDKTHFCKLQVLKTYLKTETGIVGDARSMTRQYRSYPNRKLVVDQAHKEIKERIAQEYRLNDELFTFDFTETEASKILGYRNKLPKSTPTSPQRPLNDSQPEKKPEPEKKEHVKPMEIMYAKQKIQEDDNESELSCDLDDPKHNNFNKSDLDDFKQNRFAKKPEFKRSESRVRSVSPKRTKVERDLIDESPLGDPISGPLASFQLAQKLTKQGIDGWYWSEKIDGIRCFWDGTDLWSKKGKKYKMPDFFTEFFPKSPLDGELWLGKGNSSKLSAILQKKKPKESEWNNVKFVVYDAPELSLPFKKRLEKMTDVFEDQISPYITLCEYKICKDKAELGKIKDKVEKEGGEGLMLRDPQGFYEKGKSCSLLEINTYHEDEATVVAHEEGKGKYENKTGGLRVKDAYGREFVVTMGMSDALREKPPKIGSKIKYKFRGVTEEGNPKNVSLIRNEDE